MYEFRFGRRRKSEHPLARIRDINVRYRHTYILGGTGTGKTSLMLRMALYDIKYGCACIFIDPKGDHAKALYNLIPDKSRATFFSYKNPTLKINPLRKKGYAIHDIIDEFTEILDILIKQTSSTNPPASENMKEVLEEAISSIKEEDRNIDFLYNFLRYKEVRDKHLGRNKSNYWTNFDKKNAGRLSEEVMTAKRIAIRLNKFIKDERFRQIVTGQNELDIADIVKNKKIIIVDTSGMTRDKRIYITSLFSFAIKSYCEFQKQDEYKPLMFYLDECWMGINDSFEYLLSFARSFKVGLTLAHQDVHQFPDYKTVKKITSICNTKVTFLPAGNEEARLMAEIYGLEQADFRDLEEYEAWVRIGNQNSLVKTYPPPEPEKMEIPTAEIVPEMEIMENPAINFLRDCWFSC